MELNEKQLEKIRQEAAVLVPRAIRYAVPLIIGRPPSVGVRINTASGIFVERDGCLSFITAAHLLDDTIRLRAANPDIVWHLTSELSHLAFDPFERIIHRDRQTDVAVIPMTKRETEVAHRNFLRVKCWPPRSPENEEYIFVCGYPAAHRWDLSNGHFSFAPACVGGALSAVVSGRFSIQFERSRWETATRSTPPTLAQDLGGMSGGPVFSFRQGEPELVGIVSEHSAAIDVMTCSTLEFSRLSSTAS